MNKGKKPGEKRDVPGVKSAELLKLRDQYVPRGVFQIAPVFIEKGRGAIVEDVDGNEYIDFCAGISTLSIGHCNEEVIDAVKKQATKHLHTCFHVLMYESYVELAQKLAEITPGSFEKQVLLANSGAEAVENAVKIARRYTGKRGLIAFENAFHGRTAMAMGLTSQVKYYKYGFGPFDPSIQRFPYAYSYRAPFDVGPDKYAEYCVQKIEDSFKTHTPAEETAAIIVEPVLGEGGFVAPPPAFIKGLRHICDKYKILLIADEVQSGMGRTGKMWAIEHYGVVPDMLLSAKGLGGGLVISAVVGRRDIMDSVDIGGVGGTFGGNPLSCAAALKTIEVIEKDNLLARAISLGKITTSRLEEMKLKYSLIGDVRGLGCMIGVELVKDRQAKEAAAEETGKIQRKCLERGLLIMSCGALHNVFRLMFPLVISENELNTGLDIFEDSLRNVS
ncbi:MAG: 4-aminobutyrate--2-oxoglutarate transaminase [Dehalococcoidales bacterium]|jgi:4-aminobutyrate aminotransferase/(S)-3-amino-2-methylpropionate transaminase